MVGKNYAQLTGDQLGIFKLIFHAETKQLLGVHILGEAYRAAAAYGLGKVRRKL